jgi:hypothetical protein
MIAQPLLNGGGMWRACAAGGVFSLAQTGKASLDKGGTVIR